jgi:hypothetical protein
MRRAGAILCLILAGSPALAQNTFRSGDWSGAASFNGQQFSHCTVGKRFSDGLQLVVQITAQLNVHVGASKQGWNLNAGTYEISFAIGQTYRKDIQGRVDGQNRDLLRFSLGNDAEFRRAFALGGTMTWSDNRGNRIPFELAGADNAMRKLLACAALYGAE